MRTRTVGADPEVPAGIQVAARQALLNYVTQQGLTLIQSKVTELPFLNATKVRRVGLKKAIKKGISLLKCISLLETTINSQNYTTI